MKEFKDTIDDVISGKIPKDEAVFVNKKTPDIIQALGFNDLPIAITQKHIISIIAEPDGTDAHNHGIDKDIMSNIYKKLSSPVMILTSYKNADRAIVVTDELDKNGFPIIIILQNNGNMKIQRQHFKVNIINSIYGKENFAGFLNNALVHDELMYYNHEKSRNLPVRLRNSFPKAITNYDSNIIIRQLSGKVNTLLQNNFVNNDEKNNELRLASEKLIELGSSEAVAKTNAVLLIPIAKENLAKLETKEPITQKENTIKHTNNKLTNYNKNNQ